MLIYQHVSVVHDENELEWKAARRAKNGKGTVLHHGIDEEKNGQVQVGELVRKTQAHAQGRIAPT